MVNIKRYYLDRTDLLTSNRPCKSLSPRITDLETLHYVKHLVPSLTERKRLPTPQWERSASRHPINPGHWLQKITHKHQLYSYVFSFGFLSLLTQFTTKTGTKSSKHILTAVELWLEWWLLLFLSMQLMTERVSAAPWIVLSATCWPEQNHPECLVSPPKSHCLLPCSLHTFRAFPELLGLAHSSLSHARFHSLVSCWANMTNTAGAPVRERASGQDLRPVSNWVECIPKSEGFHGSHRMLLNA